MNNQKVFLITGVSSGLGRAFASAALSAGHLVVGTVREEKARKNFESEKPGFSHGILLDVTDFDAIDPAVAEIELTIGPISVLVNNAGYGHEGVIEESPLSELRRQFDVNVFGAVAMIKAVPPFMRKCRAGHIINITSMGGYITRPCFCSFGSICGSTGGLSLWLDDDHPGHAEAIAEHAETRREKGRSQWHRYLTSVGQSVKCAIRCAFVTHTDRQRKALEFRSSFATSVRCH
jgi:NAD(P)-dependent dehydrogenase (short-subunit alcohol dehydrogenase family)